MSSFRIAKLIALYLGVMLLTVATGYFGMWQTADVWLFGRVQQFDPPALASDIALIDIPYPDEFRRTDNPETFRRALGVLLKRLVEDPARVPRAVILDIHFFKSPLGAEALIEGLNALRRANVRVFGTVHLGDAGRDADPHFVDEHLAVIYREHLDNFGHTRVYHHSGVLWYDVVDGPDSRPALPVAIQDNVHELIDSLPRKLVVPLGAENMARTVTYCFSLEGQCAGADRDLHAGALHDKRVIIGSFAADRNNPLDRPGPEIMAWAISDMSAQGSRRGVAPLDAPLALLAISVFLAALSVSVFYASYRWVCRISTPAALPKRIPAVAITALVTGLAVWLGLWLLMLMLRISLPVVICWTSIGIATALCVPWARQSAHEALVNPQADDVAPVEYDVFISYSHEPAVDAQWVKREIHAPLAGDGSAGGGALRVFLDEGDIQRGANWKREIDRAIAGSRIFVPVFTPRYFERPQCRDELAFAEQRRSSGYLTILPITRMPMRDVPDIYRKLQGFREGEVQMFLDEVRRHCSGVR